MNCATPCAPAWLTSFERKRLSCQIRGAKERDGDFTRLGRVLQGVAERIDRGRLRLGRSVARLDRRRRRLTLDRRTGRFTGVGAFDEAGGERNGVRCGVVRERRGLGCRGVDGAWRTIDVEHQDKKRGKRRDEESHLLRET
ncbi:hypothetical protein [Bradyrhizobium sp. USDA 4341]